MVENERLIDYKGPFPFFFGFSTIPPKYLNEVIWTLIGCNPVVYKMERSVCFSLSSTRKINKADLKKALLDHLSKSSTGLPFPPIPHQQP